MTPQPPSKHYALVFDVSPSEQLDAGAASVKNLGMALPYGSRQPLEEVGQRFEFRKWRGAPPGYKQRFVDFALEFRKSREMMTARSVANERFIRKVGQRFFELHMGPIETDNGDLNNKGRPRVLGPGGFVVGGETVVRQRVLVDDLWVLGWLGYEFFSLRTELEKSFSGVAERRHSEPPRVTLELLADRLPRDTADYYRMRVLKVLLARSTDGRVDLLGHSAEADSQGRDLLADNLAGLSRDLEAGTWTAKGPDATDVFFMSKHNCPQTFLSLPGLD